MRFTVSALVALALVAANAGSADAASQQHRKRLKVGHAGNSYTAKARGIRKAATGGESDYYEHILDKVPFGSKRWWSIYEEQSGTPN
jgi:hypothetical protein